MTLRIATIFAGSLLSCLGGIAVHSMAEDAPKLFTKTQISNEFYSEGAAIGDFNKDGKMDVVVGPYWYEGPDFTKKHQFAAEEFMTKPSDPLHYSKNFFGFTYDLNGDGWTDIIICGFPGEDTAWYENPQGKDEPWKRHVMLKHTDNESPTFGDLLGHGKPVLICMSGGTMGYATPDASDPTKEWTWHPTSPKIPSYQRFTHGLGFGDVNGDGRMDLLDKDGWYEQPASLDGDPHWKKHPVNFGNGGAQMYVYDVNGDGLPDVITSIEAHGYGLAWFEQKKGENGEPTFVKHVITGDKPQDSPYGVKFAQPHALALADMFGDGLMDIVTGKRYWAHGPGGDKDPSAPAVLYVFRLVRGAEGQADFVPYLVDDNSGVGTQVTVGNIAGGKHPDILVGNKKGGFVFINQLDKLGKEAVEKAATAKVAESK
jgi:hypothetical protein